jgi:hypothetical protein
MSRKNDLTVKMHETTFNSDGFIQFVERFVAQTVKNTVGILGNCSIHKSKKCKAKSPIGRKRMY